MRKLLLAINLQNCRPGTQMAGAYVAEDGTATIELFERHDTGWWNLTTDQQWSSDDMSDRFDDFVLTRLSAADRPDTR